MLLVRIWLAQFNMSKKECYSHTRNYTCCSSVLLSWASGHRTCPVPHRPHLKTSLSSRHTPGNWNTDPRPVSCIVMKQTTLLHVVNVIFITFSLISSLGTSTEIPLPSKHHKQGPLPVEIDFAEPRNAIAGQGGGNKRRERRETMRDAP